jgi:hypothetical protein
MIQTFTTNRKPKEVYHYTTSRWDWQDGNVNQMWIEEVDDNQYVAIAHNPRNNATAVLSNPRNYHETLRWVRKFCGSFSIIEQ